MKKTGVFVMLACLVPVAAPCATPIIGDWDGDGQDNVGLFSGNEFLLDVNDDGVADAVVPFGRSTDLPVSGDFNGDGFDDIGVFRSADRRFFVDIDLDGLSEGSVTIGRSDDLPVVGDWDNDGADDVGVFRPSVRRYYMDFNEDGIHDRAVTIGKLGDYSLVGDWNGDGVDSIGVFRPSIARFYLDDDDDGVHDHAQYFGRSTDIPVIGDWDGDGDDDIGVYRPTTNMFYLDEDFDGIADWSVPGPQKDDSLTATGTWTGQWISDFNEYGSITATIVQTGAVLSGVMTVTNTDCGTLSNLALYGSVSNANVYSFEATYNCDGDIATLEYTNGVIAADGETMAGDYTVYVNGEYYDSGTFDVTR